MIRRCLHIVCLLFINVACFSQGRTLDYYLQQGLANSPLLSDLATQVRTNSLDSQITRAGKIPQVNFNTLLSYAPVINGYGYSEAITNGGNFISVISVSQPLFNRKTLEAQYSKLGLKSGSVINMTRLTERELKKAVTAQYLTACAVLSEINMDQALVTQGREQEKVLDKMVQSGLYRQTDLMSFVLELQSLEIQLTDLQSQYGKELSDLNQLCGIGDTAEVLLVLPDLVANISSGQRDDPFFRRFVIDSLQIRNELLILDRGYRPRISWFTDAGMVNNDPALVYKNLGMSFGLSLSLPVYDGNQRKLNAEKLASSEKTRWQYREFFRVQYDQQLRQLSESLKRTNELIPRLSKHLELAESIVKQDKTLLNSGNISVTEYLIAVKNYIAIRSELNRYRIKALQITNEINYWRE